MNNNSVWIFSNQPKNTYCDLDQDWDISTIIETKKYYLKDDEKNRKNVQKDDIILFREYGTGFLGTCKIASTWQADSNGITKHGVDTGWFEIDDIQLWNNTLPYELIKDDLTNKGWRLRIASATHEDLNNAQLAFRLFRKMGYSGGDGDFFVLENGLEEAVKMNLKQLNLTLASKDKRQQCQLAIGVGRTDLICLDEKGNYVVIELKASQTSDEVIGQICRYLGYIQENWANNESKTVSGIVITPYFDEQLRLAAMAANIKVLRIRLV